MKNQNPNLERCDVGPVIFGPSWPALRADLIAIGAPTV